MKTPSAFSLIELSIVIIVIGILIAGVTQGGTIIKKARLNAARSLTKSSPVAVIDNLMLWYETSLESSFDSSSQQDATAISTWYDNNPQVGIASRINATQSTSSGYQPKFYSNIFNGGIPAVRFDGSDDYMDFDGSLLVGTNYTVFVVEQRRASPGYHFFGGSDTSGTNKNLYFGYALNSLMRLGHVNANLDFAVSGYSSPTTRIHTGRLESSVSRSYWLNGGTDADSTNTTSSYTGVITSYSGPTLGRVTNASGVTYFNGDLAEIIFFTRALETGERQAVETYLGKKYGVKIG